jgi:C4-dicarboxylate-specific signal transduction histidine kinase
MKSQQQERLREMQLSFVGILMAGLSHEFKNHLAIIKELNGLTEDLLLFAESEKPAMNQRLQENMAGINQRIGQAAEMCRFLSGFSHRMDQPLGSFSVAEVLQEEIYLLRRFAWQKQVHLDASFAGDVPTIYNNPALLQFALFCIAWPALAALEKDGRIHFGVKRQGGSVEIIVNLQGEMKISVDDNQWRQMLPEVLQRLEAEHSQSVLPGGNRDFIVRISSVETLPHGHPE